VRIVGLEIEALEFRVAFPAPAGPSEVDPQVLFGVPVAEDESAAVGAQGFVDEGGGARPAGRIERRIVKRREDPLERVLFARDRTVA